MSDIKQATVYTQRKQIEKILVKVQCSILVYFFSVLCNF